MPRRALTSLAVALLLACAPGVAFADGGAGDNQYQDPLAAAPTKKPKKKPAPTTTPAASTAPAAATAPAATTPTQPVSSSSGQLPRTGAPTGLIGLGGVTFILAGISLRRRTAPQ